MGETNILVAVAFVIVSAVVIVRRRIAEKREKKGDGKAR